MNRSDKVRVILQARTDSERLPAKSLLPIAGQPLAVLAALRLANTGLRVVLGTSDRIIDNAVAQAAKARDIPVFRGSADDVLGRFVGACADLDDDAIVVRATGDNPFPDGALAETVISELETTGADIAGVLWPQSGLPYGVSLEAFRVSTLRNANNSTGSSHDREHVTPYLWRSGKTAILPLPKNMVECAHLRATVDILDDYITIESLFSSVNDPVHVPMRELVARLSKAAGPPLAPKVAISNGKAHGKLVLGAVQLGLAYGRGPEHERPNESEAIRIVRTAIRHSVTHIDTARAYGDSEERIDKALRGGWASRVQVITKLAPLDMLAPDADDRTVDAFVEASVFQSLAMLRHASPPTLLLHRAAHHRKWGGRAWQRLVALRDEGLIGGLGISVSTPDEMSSAAADPAVEIIQFPCNALDNRWSSILPKIASERGETLLLHARSALLQGLLVQNDLEMWPRMDRVNPREILASLESAANRFSRVSVADFCFAYLRANPFIDSIVVGTPTLRALESTLALFARPPLDASDVAYFVSNRPKVPQALLDPANWPQQKS